MQQEIREREEEREIEQRDGARCARMAQNVRISEKDGAQAVEQNGERD